MKSQRGGPLAACLLLAFLAFPPSVAHAQGIRYGYDASSRLQWIQDQNGDVAIWVYDPAGNILQIVRGNFPDPNAPVGISGFAPMKASEGAVVTVFGRGFSPTPAENTLTFNGTPATIAAASAVQLTVTVPAGAATGPLAVTAPAGTGTSAQPFTVLTAPTISPATALLLTRASQIFTSTQPSQWRVNGIANGNTAVGILSVSPGGTTATYTAPAAVPAGNVVTIAAANQDDLTLQGSAAVTIAGIPPAPRVSVSVSQPPTQATPLAASRVSLAVSQPPTQAAALSAPRVSLAVNENPTQATPLAASRVSLAVSQPPTQAAALSAPRVSLAASQPPTQATPLTARRVAVERQPVITGISPGSIARGSSNVSLTLTGQGLANATALQFLNNGTNDTLITYSNLAASPDGTQATVTVNIGSAAVIAGRVAQITAGGVISTPAGTGTNVLQVTGP
jgi:hypothetical protein